MLLGQECDMNLTIGCGSVIPNYMRELCSNARVLTCIKSETASHGSTFSSSWSISKTAVRRFLVLPEPEPSLV